MCANSSDFVAEFSLYWTDSQNTGALHKVKRKFNTDRQGNDIRLWHKNPQVFRARNSKQGRVLRSDKHGAALQSGEHITSIPIQQQHNPHGICYYRNGYR